MRRALSQTQAAELLRAASVLPPASRDAFFAAVDSRLVGIRRQLTDDDVNAAIVTVLADASITTTSHFMCDAAPAKEAAMARKFEIVDRYGNPVDDDIIPDGGRLRVPLMMRDGTSDVQRALAEDAVARRFGLRHALDLHQSGPRYCTDAAGRERKAEAYRQMCADLQVAWQTPSAPTAAAAVPQPVEVRDARPPIPVTDADFARQRRIKQAAYNEMVDEMTSAWKGPAR